ncbi:MAG TPA: hypothetical protein VKE98_09175 [Gemmataceae bacterium]|nr:hypothetical protein [Gemmataceae bacterium]
MNTWQKVWREGLAPRLSTSGLHALRRALVADDQRLLQGDTTCPPYLDSLGDEAVQAACALGYCAWKGGDGLFTVSQVNAQFERICWGADVALKEPAACRVFLHWFDKTPRKEMRRQLLEEVNRTLEERRNMAA